MNSPRLTASPRYHLPDDPAAALRKIAGYLRTARTDGSRAVRHDGETLGYWQTPEWLDGLSDIAGECERVAEKKGKA